VIVFAGIRATDNHDDEIRILVHHLVANWRFEEMTVFVNPGLKVNGGNEVSHDKPPNSFWSSQFIEFGESCD